MGGIADNGPERYFAAVGDVHGRQRRMVELLESWERDAGKRLDFVLQVGDFEPVRNADDFALMVRSENSIAPVGAEGTGDFADFHTGRARFPWPIYIVGGNHEPYGWLDALADGAPLAENCFYMGRAGCIELGGLRVVGLSGIHSPKVFAHGRPRGRGPRNPPRRKALTYFDARDVERAISHGTADVVVVHEWPAGAFGVAHDDASLASARAGTNGGRANGGVQRDVDGALRATREQMLYPYAHRPAPGREPRIGNAHTRSVVDALRPRLVLAGHMHFGHRNTLRLPTGESTAFVALASVDLGADAIAVFHLDARGEISEVPL